MPWLSWLAYLPLYLAFGFDSPQCFAYNHICWIILIALNILWQGLHGFTENTLELVVIRQIRIGLGSDISNKTQTYPLPCVGKASLRYVSSYQPRTLTSWVAHVCCGTKFKSGILRFVRLYSAVWCRTMGSCRSMLLIFWIRFLAWLIRLVFEPRTSHQ